MSREVQSICACTHWYGEEQRTTNIVCSFLEGRWLQVSVRCSELWTGQGNKPGRVQIHKCTQNMSHTQKYVSYLARGKKLTLPIHTNNGVKYTYILTYILW